MFEMHRGRNWLRSLAATAVVVAVTVLAACSSDDATPPPCDDAKCAPGNKCLALEGEVKCRKTCASNIDPATSCPFGYTCTDTDTNDTDPATGVPPFCVQDKAVNGEGKPLVRKESGQWGAKCQANLGVENPGCDLDQGFYCYGISPTDGAAYCTRYDCQSDAECGAGFWCGKINQAPNVATTKRSAPGAVQNVCLRRTYCATCKVDLDCPTVEGVAQHCVPDGSGTTVCLPECGKSANCPNEAQCVAFEGLAARVCYPRATVCVGDGSLCSPCRVDTDCGEDGVCVKGQYTTEKACAKKAPSSCDGGESNGGCPTKLETAPGTAVRCLGGLFDEVPANYCHGLYPIGDRGGDIGCWTPKR